MFTHDTNGICPFLCSGGTLLSTDLTLQVGGWDTSLRVGQDISLIAALNVAEPGGWVGTQPVLGYRKHPASTTAYPAEPAEEAAVLRRVRERAAQHDRQLVAE